MTISAAITTITTKPQTRKQKAAGICGLIFVERHEPNAKDGGKAGTSAWRKTARRKALCEKTANRPLLMTGSLGKRSEKINPPDGEAKKTKANMAGARIPMLGKQQRSLIGKTDDKSSKKQKSGCAICRKWRREDRRRERRKRFFVKTVCNKGFGRLGRPACRRIPHFFSQCGG